MGSHECRGRKDFILKEKSKRSRGMLRWWNKKVFGWVDLRMEEAVKYLNNIDNHLAENNYNNTK